MVKDFLGSIKNSNQQTIEEKLQQNPTKSNASNYKANKKPVKSKKSHTKNLFNAEEIIELPQTSTKKSMDFSGHSKCTTTVASTKVKSGSWKRSEKSIAPFNALTNKKHKKLRKKSPNWLKFANSKVKIPESNQLVNGGKPTSACRPGTLYSDVLFGAGCSNLVKIKNLTPRHSNNATIAAAQKKLTKALFKFTGNHENETSDESEIEGKKNLFPALQKINNKTSSPSLSNNTNNNEVINTSPSLDTISNQEITTSSSTPPTKNQKANEKDDVVILSDLKSPSLTDNDMSHGNCLEQYFENFNGKIETEASSSTNDSKFLVSSISNIPKWNFTDAESGSEGFPKFLGQFDDENYLKAEKIAWLGLKLALGNNSGQSKFF